MPRGRQPMPAQASIPAPGLEAGLWQSVEGLRGTLDVAEYKYVVLGLVFLKYVCDVFEAQRARLEAERAHGADPENPTGYRAANVFWVPPEARWSRLRAQARRPTIGRLIDDSRAAIERDNPSLAGIWPAEYSRADLDPRGLGEIVERLSDLGPGAQAERALERAYDRLLEWFAEAEGLRGGPFHTPRCVARVLVEMLAPLAGCVYDPCCGAGGLLVQSRRFIEAHGGRRSSYCGQESRRTAWQLARMNLVLHGVDAHIVHGDSLRDDAFPVLAADYVVVDPPFNLRWEGAPLPADARWRYGTPPARNANFAWVQHAVHHLAPSGHAGILLANGSMWSRNPAESAIRRALVADDLIDCVVALPGQLFHSTPIPACLWLLARDKRNRRDRRGEVLFIDARALGVMRDRLQRELADDEIERLAQTYHAWRGDRDCRAAYEDIPGYCRRATLDEIARHAHVLTPGAYVDSREADDGGDVSDAALQRLVATLHQQMEDASRLDEAIRRGLKGLGYGAE